MTLITGFTEMARSSTRADFVKACPYPFLVGSVALVKPRVPQRTQSNLVVDFDLDQPLTMNGPAPDLAARSSAPPAPTVVLAIRKVQPQFPAMITIGRTANNDLVISDVQVSKFHAFFRIGGGRWELADAGSRNGTFVGGRQLQQRAAPTPLFSGDVVRIAHLEFTFVDAGGCWDLVQRRVTGHHTAAAGPSEK
jgi:hypothetical protein